jgi:glucosamine--fructose-6-phosphate aminotransferase (isomerizing)
MDDLLPVVEGPYLRDILDQPRALRETLSHLALTPELEAIAARLAHSGFRRVVLTGMGSSLHGLVPLQLRLVEAGHTAALVDCSELLHYQRRLLDQDTLLVLVSQSGRSAEVVRLLEAVRGRGVVSIGVTNTLDSPLAVQADAVVLTRAGEEATVACKTSLAAQLVLTVLGELLAVGDPAAARIALGVAIPQIATYLATWRAHTSSLVPLLAGVRMVFYAGRGRSLAAALTAGLITKESTHTPSEGMTSAAFRHGPMEMLGDAAFLLVFSGERRTLALNQSLVKDARAAGARAYLAGEEAEEPVFRLPGVPDLARPLVELLPVEMITLALAALAGRESGRFERAAKVTSTE